MIKVISNNINITNENSCKKILLYKLNSFDFISYKLTVQLTIT